MEVIKVKEGRYLKPIQLIYKDDRIFLKFKYNKKLIEEIRSFDGPKWHGYDEPPRKIWSIKNSPRNLFQLQYLDVDSPDPYAHYDRPLVEHTPRRKLYDHQVKLLRHAITYCHCIFAAEMGLGKTIQALTFAEQHPEIKLNTKISKEAGIENPAVICGENYYNLEQGIANKIKIWEKKQ